MNTPRQTKLLSADDIEPGMFLAVHDIGSTPATVDRETWDFRKQSTLTSLGSLVPGTPLEVLAVDRPFLYCRSVTSVARRFVLDTRVVIIRRVEPAAVESLRLPPDTPRDAQLLLDVADIPF